MKILFSANKAWNLAHFRKPIVEGLVRDGHEVIALSPQDEGVEMLAQLAVSHKTIHIDSEGASPVRDARLALEYRREIRDLQPDVMLGFTIKPNVYGSFAAQSLGVPFLPSISGLGTAFMQPGFLQTVAERLYWASFRKLPFVVFQNEEDRNQFVDRKIVVRDQTVLVPGSGVDLVHYAPAPLPQREREGITFLLIARLLRDKGVLEFVGAAKRIRQKDPTTRFQLLGEVGVENRTAIDQASVDRWVKEGIVEYLGKTDDIRAFVRKADCVVLPSYREGAPRTLLEAAAMGRPVVATDVPGCRQVVEHGKTGLLCRARDSDDLALAVSQIMEMGNDQRKSMGLAGRAKMEREFCDTKVVEIYRGLVNELAKRASR